MSPLEYKCRVAAFRGVVLCSYCSSKVYALKQIEGAGLSLSACREIAVSLWGTPSVLGIGYLTCTCMWVTRDPDQRDLLRACLHPVMCFFPLHLSPAAAWVKARQYHQHAASLSLPHRSQGVATPGLCRAWPVGECLHKWNKGRALRWSIKLHLCANIVGVYIYKGTSHKWCLHIYYLTFKEGLWYIIVLQNS